MSLYAGNTRLVVGIALGAAIVVANPTLGWAIPLMILGIMVGGFPARRAILDER